MSIPENISYSPLNNLGPPLQESSSWTGKVITKVRATASFLVSSIGSVAQSILSNFIYVGTLGRYTLDDLKDYFSKENAFLEDRALLEDSQKIIKREVPEYEYKLLRQGSKMSVTPSLYDRIEQGESNGSLYPYGIFKSMIKLPSDKLDIPIGPLGNPPIGNDFDDRLI